MAQAGFVPNNSVDPVEMLDGIVRRTLGTTDKLMLAEFHIDKDAVVPMHSHPHEQVGYVVSGQLELTIEGVARVCGPGDTYQIPGDVEHMGRGVSDCVVIDCFTPPREDYR